MDYAKRVVGFGILVVGMSCFAQRLISHVTRSDGGFSTEIIIVNPTDVHQQFALTAFDKTGRVLVAAQNHTVQPSESMYVSPEDLFGTRAVSHFSVSQDAEVKISVAYRANREGSVPAHVNESSVVNQAWCIHPSHSTVAWDGLAVVNVGDHPMQASMWQISSQGEIVDFDDDPFHGMIDPNAKGLYVMQHHFEPLPQSHYRLATSQPTVVTSLRGSSDSMFLWENAPVPLDAVEKSNDKFGFQEAHFSLWDMDPNDYTCGTIDQAKRLFDDLDSVRAKNFRYTIFWTLVERNTSGDYDWGPHDELIDYLFMKGLDISIMIQGVNAFYHNPERPPLVRDEPYHQAWLRFIRAVVTRFGSKVSRWEIGNEEDSAEYWAPEPSPRDYSEFLISTVDQIRAIQPNAFVIMGGVTVMPQSEEGFFGSREFLAECFHHHVLDYVDAVGIHVYRTQPEGPFDWGFEDPSDWNEATFEGEMEYLRNLIDTYNRAVELWNTESGFVNFDYLDRHTPREKLHAQLKHVTRSMLVEHAAGLKGLTHFRLRVSHEPVGSIHPFFQGLIEEINGAYVPRPAFRGFRVLSHHLGSNTAVHQETIHTHVIIDREERPLRLEVFSEAGQPVIAYWLPEPIDDTQKSVQRVDLNIAGLRPNSFYVRDILSQATSLPLDYSQSQEWGGILFRNLPVTDYPFILYTDLACIKNPPSKDWTDKWVNGGHMKADGP